MLGLDSRKELKRCKAAFPYLMLFLNISVSSKQGLSAIVKALSHCKGPLSPFSWIFYKLHAMISLWGYKQHQACLIATKMAKDPSLRGLLTRLAQALGVGTSISDFFKLEYSKFTASSQREHQSLTDRLRGLSEAYSAILTAGTVMSVSMLMTSTLLGTGSPSVTLASVFGGILAASASLSFLMYTSSIRVNVITDLPMKPSRLKKLESWGKFTCFGALPLGPMVLLFFDEAELIPKEGPFVPSLALALPGALAFFIGRLGLREVKKVKNLESQFSIFIKVLGEASVASGTLHQGLHIASANDFGPLTHFIQRLSSRLKLGVKDEVAWIHFAGETGSRLISDLIHILLATVRLGSKIGDACYSLFEAANEELTRRAKREQVASFLKGLVYPIQGTLVAVLTLTSVLMGLLSRFVSYAGVGIVSPVEPHTIELFSFAVMFSLATVSALSIYFVSGGTFFVFLSNLGSLLLLSALVHTFLGIFATSLLEGFAQLGSRLTREMP